MIKRLKAKIERIAFFLRSTCSAGLVKVQAAPPQSVATSRSVTLAASGGTEVAQFPRENSCADMRSGIMVSCRMVLNS